MDAESLPEDLGALLLEAERMTSSRVHAYTLTLKRALYGDTVGPEVRSLA